jgi:hypothetical protein
MTESEITVFWREIHHKIIETARRAVSETGNPSFSGEFMYATPDEAALARSVQAVKTLGTIQLDSAQRGALTWHIADSIANVLFDQFCLFDGVTDPETSDGTIGEINLAPENGAMLHDDFISSYSDYLDWVSKKL